MLMIHRRQYKQEKRTAFLFEGKQSAFLVYNSFVDFL